MCWSLLLCGWVAGSDRLLPTALLRCALAAWFRGGFHCRLVSGPASRPVPAGSGFHGYFECGRACADWTKAEFLDTVGKKTPVFVRFSTVAGERGSADTVRDPRGFAIKFYTEDGNYDMVGNNTPVFFINDGIKFADFIHSQKRDPKSHLRSPTMWYDFWQHRPESVHQVMWLMGPRGLPAGFQYMNGYSGHAFKFVNAEGKFVWFKFQLKAEQGVKCLSQAEGDKLAGTDPDYHQRLMFNLLERGGEAAWKVYVQLMTDKQAQTLEWNPFDITWCGRTGGSR